MDKVGIIFDIDDTLITHTKAEYLASQKFGNLYSEKIINYKKDTFPEYWKDISNIYFTKFLEGVLTFKGQQVERMREVFGQKNMLENDANIIFSNYLKFYEQSWELFKDVVPFLEKCQQMDIPLGIISDGSMKQQQEKLHRTGISKYFNFVITAEEMNCCKPDARLFKKGKDSFSEDLKKVFYIGDNLEKDAKGSNNSGLKGIWLNREQKKGSFSKVITSLEELSVASL